MASITRVLALMLAVAVAGCTTKKTEPPPLSGPSELGTTLDVRATPDVLTMNGTSESQIVVHARGPNGEPLGNLPVRVDVLVGFQPVDFGQISAKNVQTGGDGRVILTYRAPASDDDVDRDTRVQIMATPVGSNYNSTFGRYAEIRLVPSGTVGGDTQVPDFAFEPAAPVQMQTVTFDAYDEALAGNLVDYEWDYGDGSTGRGRSASHAFDEVGNFSVTLTVTDRVGRKGSRSKNVPVTAGEAPTSEFVFSPTKPDTDDQVVFNGSGSKSPAPRAIVSYKWVFGDGETGSGMIVSHRFDDPGTYVVTLTVTDDAGNTATSSQSVEVVAAP